MFKFCGGEDGVKPGATLGLGMLSRAARPSSRPTQGVEGGRTGDRRSVENYNIYKMEKNMRYDCGWHQLASSVWCQNLGCVGEVSAIYKAFVVGGYRSVSGVITRRVGGGALSDVSQRGVRGPAEGGGRAP